MIIPVTRCSLSVTSLSLYKVRFLVVLLCVTDPKLLHSQPTVPVFGFNNYGDDRYEVINYKMSWEKAEKNCRDQSAELASVLDPYAEAFLWLQILKYGEPVWIGLNSNMVSPPNACDSHTNTFDKILVRSIDVEQESKSCRGSWLPSTWGNLDI